MEVRHTPLIPTERGLRDASPCGGLVLFDVRVRQHGAWTVISVTGELDMASAPEVRSRVVSAVSGLSPSLVLDLTQVEFMDSIGLGVVVGAHKRVRSQDGNLAVVCDSERLRKLFSLTDLDKVLRLERTLDDVLFADHPRSGDPAVDEDAAPLDGAGPSGSGGGPADGSPPGGGDG